MKQHLQMRKQHIWYSGKETAGDTDLGVSSKEELTSKGEKGPKQNMGTAIFSRQADGTEEGKRQRQF